MAADCNQEYAHLNHSIMSITLIGKVATQFYSPRMIIWACQVGLNARRTTNMKYFVSYQTMGMTIPPIMADECPEPRHHDNLDPTWGIECLIPGQQYKCRLCGSRPARLVVRLWEDGLRTRVPLCDTHLQASIAAFQQNTLDAAR